MNFPKRRRRRCPVFKAVQWRSGEQGFTPVSEPSARRFTPAVFSGISQPKRSAKVHGWLGGHYRSAPCAITAYMRSQLVPQRSRRRWCRPNSNLRRPGALRARPIRRLRSAFVQEPSSHSRMTFKPAVSCFGRKSAIGWHGFARSPSTSRAAITTRWNFQMVRSFWSPISQLDNGPRCCNCP
jgi:hypothetical protein